MLLYIVLLLYYNYSVVIYYSVINLCAVGYSHSKGALRYHITQFLPFADPSHPCHSIITHFKLLYVIYYFFISFYTLGDNPPFPIDECYDI